VGWLLQKFQRSGVLAASGCDSGCFVYHVGVFSNAAAWSAQWHRRGVKNFVMTSRVKKKSSREDDMEELNSAKEHEIRCTNGISLD
jgi:hypothetical protein